MTVTLDATEVVVAQMLAAMRYNVARMAGVTNARIGSQDDYQTDLEGMAGELAFCKAFNYFPDLTVGPRKGGWDVKGRAGETIDIKVTKYNSGKLLATLKKKPEDAQYYVLMVGECPTYRLAGYATAEELLKPENITDLGHGEGYSLTQDQLKQFDNKGGQMEYKTTCRLCKNDIVIEVDDEKDAAAKEVGVNLDIWIGNSKVLCEPCYTYKETGHRPTNTPPMKDFLFE